VAELGVERAVPKRSGDHEVEPSDHEQRQQHDGECAARGGEEEYPGDRDLQLVRSTIELGHALDMRVVAEGIEDRRMLDLLRELGCDVAQGYFIGKPAPADGLAFAAGHSPAQANDAAPSPALSGDLVPNRDTIERRRLHRVAQRA
jgi:hypothetical protein